MKQWIAANLKNKKPDWVWKEEKECCEFSDDDKEKNEEQRNEREEKGFEFSPCCQQRTIGRGVDRRKKLS